MRSRRVTVGGIEEKKFSRQDAKAAKTESFLSRKQKTW
jgi:hypothetical protein